MKRKTSGTVSPAVVVFCLCFLMLVGALALFSVLLNSRRDVARSNTRPPPPLVKVMEMHPETYRTVVKGFGTVKPHRKVRVLPQVGGVIVEQNEYLEVGGRIRAGELLVQIDQRDYEAALAAAEAEAARADFELQLEKGRQVVAKREWELLGPIGASEANEGLALRVPQLASRQAAMESANSRVMKAKADLERTTLRSPFDALVISESAEVGQFVLQQTPVADLVCLDEYRVQVTLPMDRLSRICVPKNPGDEGSPARVILDSGSGALVVRDGRVVRLLPDLDPNGRLARIHVSIPDPLQRDENSSSPPLLLGSYVRVEIEGAEIEGAFVIPRAALRDNSRLWIVDEDGLLQWKEIQVLDRTEEHVIVQDRLESGVRVIVSALSSPLPGMEVRVLDDDAVSLPGEEASPVVALQVHE